jgi:hypothetical protein
LNNFQALELIKSALYANSNGKFLTLHITLCWRFCGIQDQERGFAAFQTFRELLRKWLHYHGHELACVWANENSRTNGFHSHLLFHCPAHLIDPLRAIAPNWVPGEHPQTVYISTPWANANPANAQNGYLRYLMKTLDQSATLTNIETGQIVRTAALLDIDN